MKGLSYVFSRMRSKKADTTILLVVLILSTSLFTSYYFYSKNSVDILLQQKIADTPYHALVDVSSYYMWRRYNQTLPLSNVLEYMNKNYKFIDTVAYYYSIPALTNITITDPQTHEASNITDYVSVTGMPSNFTNSIFSNLIDTSIPLSQLNKSEVLVDSQYEDYFQRILAISLIGKKVYVYHFYNQKNYTTTAFYIAGTFTLTRESLEERSKYYSEYIYPEESKFGMFIASTAALRTILAENETLDISNTKIFVNFKSSFFKTDHLDYIESEMHKFKNKLSLEFQPFVYVSVYVTQAVSTAKMWVTTNFLSMIQIAYPTLIIAWVALKFEFELSGIRRRREIANLKSRGYSNLDIILLSLVEILVFVIVSLPITLAFSNVLSFLLLQYSGVIKSFNLISVITSSFDPYVLAFVFLVSFGLLFLSYLGMLLYVMSVEPVETRVYTSTELDDINLTSLDWITLFFLIPGVFAITISFSFVLASETGFLIFMSILLLLALVATYILLKIGAVIGVKVKKSILMYFSKKRGHNVITRLLSSYTHYRRKMDGFSIITIVLVLFVALSSVTTIATASNRITDLSYYYTGADISFKLSTTNLTTSMSLLNETNHITCVKISSLVRTGTAIYTVTEYGGIMSYTCNIFAIDSNFLDTAFLKDYFLNRKLIQNILTHKNGILMTPVSSWSEQSKPPSSVDLEISTGAFQSKVYKRFDLIGPVEYFPRFGAEGYSRKMVVMSIETYNEITTYSKGDYILVKLGKNANVSDVMSAITAKLQGNITKIRVAQDYIKTIDSYIENKAYFGSLFLTLLLMLFFVVVGQEILFFDKYEKMKKDIAVLKAIGIDTKQTRNFVLTDLFANFGVALALVSVLIGVLYFTDNLANRFAIYRSINFGELSTINLPFVVIIPMDLVSLILGVSLLSFIICVIPILRMLKRLNIAQEMKYEFG